MKPLKAVLGSKNPSKVTALKNVLATYEMFAQAQVEGVDVDSGVDDQPLSLERTLEGARNRALRAYEKVSCDYAFGVESGFMHMPGGKNGYIEVTMCSIYDGKEFHIGFSPAFECPQDIMDYVLEGMDLAQASNAAGYSNDPELGKKQGIVGILTKGKIDRTAYTSAAIIMAMIHVDKAKE